jgi:transcriptional regulator with GAF, ATPase, and Fis domain
MSWIQTFAFAHSITGGILTLLLGLTIAKKEKKPVELVFVLLVSAFLGWIVLNGISTLLTALGSPSDLVGSFAGLAVIFLGYAALAFGEYFPQGMELRHRKARLIAAGVVSVLVGLLVFSEDWISHRTFEHGASTARFGPYFYVTSVWAMSIMILGIALPCLKYFRTRDTRIRRHIGFFITGSLLTLMIAATFSFFLPILGYDRLLFIGPNACIVFIALMSYAIVFHELFDLRTATFRLAIRVMVSGLVGTSLYAVYFLSFAQQGWIEFSVQQIALLALLFLLGILYYPLFQRRIDQLFSPRLNTAEELLLELFEKKGLNSAEISLDQLLESILTAFASAIGFRKGLIVAGDRFHERLLYHVAGGEFPIPSSRDQKLLLLHLGVALPARFHISLMRIIRLEAGVPRPFNGMAEFRENYPRSHRAFTRTLDLLEANGYRLILPLQFRQTFYGFLAFGEKAGRVPYYSRDFRLLESVRGAVTLAVRSRILMEEIRIRKNQAEQEISQLTKFISDKEPRRLTLQDKTLIYRSPAMADLLERVKEAAPSPHPVLITGETGTGKELIAQLIHSFSRQMSQPFVVCNCAAIPPTLFEDELFGHVKGAFTDARNTRDGIVNKAGEGTLFFDEIGEMPLDMQPKLLRLLQERKYSPVGGEQVREARCRFVFATNRRLEEMVKDGTFRADLYYRINVLPIYIQPIRKRKEDIPILIEYFLAHYSRESEIGPLSIEQSAMEALLRYNWPGNVRELENTMIRAVAGARNGIITKKNVPLQNGHTLSEIAAGIQPVHLNDHVATTNDIPEVDGNFEALMQDHARKLVTYALEKAQGNKSRAAAILGIKWGKLDYQMKELGISKR